MTAKPTFANIAKFDDLYLGTIDYTSSHTPELNERMVLEDIMRIFLACKVPITLWGPVGSRKTRTIEALSRLVDENGVNYQVITMTPSTQDATIISGIFYTSFAQDGKEVVMKRSVPDVAKQIVNYYEECGGLSILFSDEMTTCSRSQQSAQLGLFTHGKFDQFDVSEYVAFVMAANPRGTVSQVNDLMESTINRGGHIPWYGDKDLFFSDWSSGWRGAVNPPAPRTQWFVEQLLFSTGGAKELEPFRNERWSIDSLVPYDRFEHSERVVTQMAEIYTFLNERLFNVDRGVGMKHVYKEYVKRVAKALMGPDWEYRVGRIVEMESDFIDIRSLLGKLSKFNVLPTMTEEESWPAIEVIRDLMAGKSISTPGFIKTAERMVKAISMDGRFNPSHYAALFLFILAAPSDAARMAALPCVKEAVAMAKTAVSNGQLPREVIMPQFITEEFMQSMRSLLSQGS